MKFSKNTATICAFILGITILTTTAFADIMLGSGYYSLKNSMKTTMGKLTDDVDNFTANVTISAKVDGRAFSETVSDVKIDRNKQARETSETYLNKGELRESYYYADENQRIYKNFEDNSYNVIETRKSNNDDRKVIENIFEEEAVMDAEKIMDAFVGSLQDIIQVEESGGKKMYMGNLSESEIPPVLNAISSFAFKYSILDEWNAKRLDIPYPKSNIYVIDACGKAVENEEGFIESGIFTASISAEDNKGNEHIYTVDFSIDIKDINKTVVKVPNFDGYEVTYSKEGYEFDSKFIGKYKNNIVEVENNSFVKIGERIVEITSVENGNVKGKYYELYDEGYEPDEIRNFNFSSNYNESEFYTILNYTNNKGEKEKGIMHRTNLQDIYVNFDVTIDEDGNGYSSDGDMSSDFVRVFE